MKTTLSRDHRKILETTVAQAIVDATLIAAAPSTKNKEGKRDGEMHQTRKGKQ